MHTRRDILKLGLLAGLDLVPMARASRIAAPVYHLFVDAEDVDALRAAYRSEPVFEALRESLAAFDLDEEYRFIDSELRYNDHLFHMRRLTDTASQMAFHYLMTGEARCADLAVDAVEAIMHFERWDYFLDGDTPIGFQRASRAATAVSLCADWLGERIDDSTRVRWLKAVAVKGCEACYHAVYGMRYPEQVEGWRIDPESTYFEHRPGDRGWDLSRWPYIFDQNNLKAEPAAALAIGAVAYEQQFGEGDDTRRWIDQAIYSIRGYTTIFEGDGSYNEGISYAGATSLHLMQAYSVLHRFRALDLSDELNWPGFMDYALGLSMPTQDNPAEVVNFGDVGSGLPSAVPFWIATHTHDPLAMWFGLERAASHSFWSVLWYPGATRTPEPPLEGPALWQSDLEWIVSRSGYDTDDLVVAMRSGPPFNHEHADRNSLIVKCYGEQLVTDPHRPAYSRTDPTWLMRETPGHSGVLIDGQGHQYVDGSEGTNASEAEAHLVRSGQRPGYHFWSSDATQAYRLVMTHVELVMRTVIVLHDVPAVVILDRVDATQPVTLQARFFGYNNDEQGSISARPEGFMTARPHADLYARSFSPQGIQTSSSLLPLPEPTASMYPFAEIGTSRSDRRPFLVTVLTPARKQAPHTAPVFEALDEQRLQIDLSGATVTVSNSGRIPEFEIITE